ncbi:MAG: nitrite reductase, copper-containing [Nitrospirae bacterium]|nr:MAG: nitrite reductase, copper-containing [Nitrospirota bacterium]
MKRRNVGSACAVFALIAAFTWLAHPAPALSEIQVKAQLTTPPHVPPPLDRRSPARVFVELEAKEYTGTLAEDVQYQFWSFNGTVPGPMIRVRVGDTVELHLKNHRKNKFPHNIDLHAVNGPGGGAGVSLVSPGQEATFAFKALNPGLYMFHCASPVPNIPAHIANGMYGMILVEPEGGLPPVDREFAVVQSEFFTKPTDTKGIYALDMQKGLAEHPDYVVFNGRVDGVIGERALQAQVGEKVRLYFGNIGPNSASSFHIIGEIFDNVYVEGAIDGKLQHNVQTTLVPSAGAVIVEFTLDVPGDYVLVDHSIFRAAKGALGILSAEGKENLDTFRSVKPPAIIPQIPEF